MTKTGEEYFVEPSVALETVADEILTLGELVARLCAIESPISERLRRSKIQKASYTDVSGDGYTSAIYRIALALVDGRDDINFILKSFSMPKIKHFTEEFFGTVFENLPAEHHLQMMSNCSAAHNAECTFYELFADMSIENLRLPKIYNVEKITVNENPEDLKGFILMEDLSKAACLAGSIFGGLNENQVRQVIDTLTDFHATLLIGDEATQKWRNKIPSANLMFHTAEALVDDLVKQLESGFDKTALIAPLKRLRKLMSLEYDNFVTEKVKNELNIPFLICHGDTWTNNLLWKRKSDGGAPSDELAAIIDWQICHQGNPMSDFSRLLITSCKTDVRERVESWLPRYYHERLVQKTNGNVKFTVENLERAYNYAKAGQAAFGAVVIEPMHRVLSEKTDDKELVAEKTRGLIDRVLASMSDAERFIAADAPEWLTTESETN